jgi:hypothetical protein
MRSKDILALLKGGDRRSIGQADRVAGMVAKEPKLFSELIKGLWAENSLVRMRAADAAEKVTRSKPELLKTYRKELLGLMAETEEQEVRWHLAQLAPRIATTARERQTAAAILMKYLEARSSIVRTFALQGLAELARDESSLQPKVVEILHQANRTGTTAMRARARMLLQEMEKE